MIKFDLGVVGRVRRVTRALILLIMVIAVLPAGAAAEQASQPGSPPAGYLSAGKFHTCSVLSGTVRCWGYGGDGALGYRSTDTIGDDETPGSVGPVNLGAGRTAKAVSAGNVHSCALLDDGTVRCWGFGGDGRLGYGNTSSIGVTQTPADAGPVDLGPGRTAKAISAGGADTCAVLDDDTVRCWGYGRDGRLGYGNMDTVGDNETPGSVAPVNLGPGRTAKAVSAKGGHTCALLDDDSVRCWGYGGSGRLGYGNRNNVGDTASTTPDTAGPVDLGPGRTAKAISAGTDHTCALLDNGSVRCWGYGANGRLGYGNVMTVGAAQTPGATGPVDLGPGRIATAISAGGDHTCATLDDGTARCWGYSAFGQLGYGNVKDVGDDEAPGSVGPIDVGPERSAIAISAGELHTCALLDDNAVRCWGYGANGRLGSCSEADIGEDETPGSLGPVDLGSSKAGCVRAPQPPADAGRAPAAAVGPPSSGGPSSTIRPVDPRVLEGARAQRLRRCLVAAGQRAASYRRAARAFCVRRHGRIPGRVVDLRARAISSTQVVLTFDAPPSDGANAPAARDYLVKQSRRPIREPGDFDRAQALCRASCHFRVTAVGTRIKLTVTDLRPRSTYYYAVAARDNVSNRRGPRSTIVMIRTR